MKNKLTLKALKQELENLKKSNSKGASNSLPLSDNHHHSTLGREIKNSYINNLHMKSSFAFWWVMSWFIFFAKKLPIINKISTLIALWYGKTTIYKILVKSRKVFVVFNAIIGMYAVYKTTGFSYDNILAGFSGLGHTYLEIFINFNKKLFHWLVEFFDHKVVPNVPNTPSTPKPSNGLTGHFWKTPSNVSWTDQLKLDNFSLRELYKNPITINVDTTPWYKDTGIFMWIGGIVLSAGLSYLTYKFFTDPTFIQDLGRNYIPFIKTTPPTPDATGSGMSGSITSGSTSAVDVANATGIVDNGKSPIIGNIKSGVNHILIGIKKLNPRYWFLSSDTATLDTFMAEQTNYMKYNNHYYPFTEYNPHSSLLKRMRIYYFGETYLERCDRISYRSTLLDQFMTLGKGKGVATQLTDSPISTMMASVSSLPPSPRIGTLGLETAANFTSGTLAEFIPGGSGSISRKLSGLSLTPRGVSNFITLPEGLDNSSADWIAEYTPYSEWTDPKPYDFFSSSSSKCNSIASGSESSFNSPNIVNYDLPEYNPFKYLEFFI